MNASDNTFKSGAADPAGSWPDVPFVTEPDSPWPDGYSLVGERSALADILDADGAETDPRWPRVLEFERREREFEEAQSRYAQRRGAEHAVTHAEATAFKYLGELVNDDHDTMVVHTLEAYRLFIGRTSSPDGRLPAIPGGKRQGSALRVLWLQTSHDNPYADWGLLLHEQATARLQKMLAGHVADCGERMRALAARGLALTLQVSAKPETLDLGFRSPYGYGVCELIVDYDLFVRYIKTLARKNQIGDEFARTMLREANRQIRGAWNEVARFERVLMRPEFKGLSRADFLPDADATARSRASGIQPLLPGLPGAILDGTLVPQHSRRRPWTDQERATMRALAAPMLAAASHAAA